MWYQSNHALKDADLAKCMKALVVKFKSPIQLSSKSATEEAPQTTPHPTQEFHKCNICSASFSSINRLLNHNQMATCGKSSCNHCEEVFDSKNKLHDHIRSHECQKLLSSKSDAAIKTALTPLSTSETIFNSIHIPPLPKALRLTKLTYRHSLTLKRYSTMWTTLFQRHQRLRLLHIEQFHLHRLLMSHIRSHTLRSLIYTCAMLHWVGLHLTRSHASWLCFLPNPCRTYTKSFMTRTNESSPHQAGPLIPRPSNMRPDKTSNMLFLNDLDSSEVFQKVRLGFIFRYQQNRLPRDSLFNNSVISSLSSMAPFLIYA